MLIHLFTPELAEAQAFSGITRLTQSLRRFQGSGALTSFLTQRDVLFVTTLLLRFASGAPWRGLKVNHNVGAKQDSQQRVL
jgi:hypothetical protein